MADVVDVEPKETIRSRGRYWKRPYKIINGAEEKTVVARDVLKALRRVKLTPGAIVTVFVPVIVQGKRARSGI